MGIGSCGVGMERVWDGCGVSTGWAWGEYGVGMGGYGVGMK